MVLEKSPVYMMSFVIKTFVKKINGTMFYIESNPLYRTTDNVNVMINIFEPFA